MEEFNLEQNSEEWLEARKQLLTASDATAIGNMGAGLETLILKKVVEQLSSGKKEHYDNSDTVRGHELEPIAADIYELDTGRTIKKVGLVINSKYPGGGCSPDRFVDEDGNLQIKCPNDDVYFKILLNGEKEITSYLWQVQMEMMISEKKWTDLMFYNPNFKISYQLFRVLPDLEKQEALKKGIAYGINKIKEIKQNYGNIIIGKI